MYEVVDAVLARERSFFHRLLLLSSCPLSFPLSLRTPSLALCIQIRTWIALCFPHVYVYKERKRAVYRDFPFPLSLGVCLAIYLPARRVMGACLEEVKRVEISVLVLLLFPIKAQSYTHPSLLDLITTLEDVDACLLEPSESSSSLQSSFLLSLSLSLSLRPRRRRETSLLFSPSPGQLGSFFSVLLFLPLFFSSLLWSCSLFSLRFRPVHAARPKEVSIHPSYFDSPHPFMIWEPLNEAWEVYFFENFKKSAKPFPVKKFGIARAKREALEFLSRMKVSVSNSLSLALKRRR